MVILGLSSHFSKARTLIRAVRATIESCLEAKEGFQPQKEEQRAEKARLKKQIFKEK